MNIIRKNPDVMLKKMSLINVLLAAIILNVHTQDNYTSIRSEKYIPVLYVGSSLSVPDLEGNSRKKIINAYAILILEMENVYDKYVYGSEEGAFPFNSEIQFNLTGYNNDDEPIENLFKPELYSLKISNKKPVAELKLNLAKTIITEDNQTMDLNRIDVENIVFTTDNEELTTSARFRLIYDIQIGYDVNNQEDLRCSAPMDLKASKTAYDNKRYTFSWEHTFPFTAYQLQLLRLYNTNGESTDPQNITADIVWSKAALYEIPITEIYDSHGNIILEKSAAINLIEGSGYYVWRVRAIGSYENGGSANSSNWGQWSQVPGPSPVTLTGGDPDDPFIYFQDIDSIKNAIYTKTFIENNKIKETSTYANGLQQVKQSQVYLPSENTTIISQTLNDHSGRPSLTTIPVPVDEKVQKYKTKFTKNSDKKLYTASDFDDPESDGIPEPMLETGNLDYYKNNLDKRIPNSNGMPFSRTLYNNDGLSRVQEESGPGLVFGLNEEGTGKTVKHFYGSPSEMELIRLFGDEAPASNSVTKKVTIDQNNIATVTYVSIEGNTLATCVSFADGGSPSLLDIDMEPGDAITENIQDKIITNVPTDWGFLSSKQIVIPQVSDVIIEYQLDCAELESTCQSLSLDCNYNIEITLTDLSTGEDTIVFSTYKGDQLTDQCSNEGIQSMPPVTLENQAPGKYLVEKKLIPGKGEIDEGDDIDKQIKPITNLLEGWIENAMCEDILPQYYETLSRFADKMNSQKLDEFTPPYTDLFGFSYDIVIWNDFLDEVYADEEPVNKKELYLMTFIRMENGVGEIIEDDISVDNQPDYILLETGCCDLSYFVKWIPTFDFSDTAHIDPHGDGKLDVYNYFDIYNGVVEGDFFPDFEGYAIAFFDDCDVLKYDPENNKKGFYDYMTGWDTTGIFNLMVYHMLTDRYYSKNPIETEKEETEETETVDSRNQEEEKDACGNLLNPVCEEDPCINYSMKQLFDCWTAQLQVLKEQAGCTNFSFVVETDEDAVNVSEAFDNEVGNTEDHDKSFDSDEALKGLKGSRRRKRRIKRKIQKNLSQMVREESANPESSVAKLVTNPPEIHLVSNFLDCSGYQFAKVLTPYEPDPLTEDAQSGVDYGVPYFKEPILSRSFAPKISMNKYLNSGTYKRSNGDYPYMRLKFNAVKRYIEVVLNLDYNPETDTALYIKRIVEFGDSLFQRIQNPIYAFKYFEYGEHARRDYLDLEIDFCFDDPNDCYFLDENGRVVVENDSIKTVPCCLRNQEDEPEDEPFCYEDISYPTGAKYVVDYFTGHGKISCEYTHESWSNGQRESFYKALNKYKPKDNWPDKADFKRYCVDYDVDTFYYKNPFFDNDSIFEEFENDSELYDLFAFSLPELISLGDLTSLGYNALKIIKKYDLERHSIDGYDRDSILKDQFSLAEMEMTEIILGCENACEKRRDDLRKQILDTLESKCYIIDRCVSSANPNVVPEADIDTMVNALIEECKSQCFINNYTCEELNLSRLIKTPKYELGQTGGFEIELFYGLAGFPISGYHDCLGRDNSSFNYIDELSPAQYTERYYDWNGDNINDAFKCKLGDIEKEEYSWYQYTKVQQASTWNLIIDLPSMCPEPETATLEYSEGCCEESGPIDETAQTFVDKQDYEKKTNTAVFDANNIKVNDQVKSPSKGLQIVIEP